VGFEAKVCTKVPILLFIMMTSIISKSTYIIPSLHKGVALFSIISSPDDYKKKALLMANRPHIDDVVLRIALTLQKSDMLLKEKDMKMGWKMERANILLKQKDMEMNLNTERKDMEMNLNTERKDMEMNLNTERKDMEMNLNTERKDMERKLLMERNSLEIDMEKKIISLQKDKDIELAKSRAHFLGMLAGITQREIIETFFIKVINLYKDKDKLVLEAINNLDPPSLKTKFIENSLKSNPSMTMINAALSNSENLRKAVWKSIGINEDVLLPSFRQVLLYPILSSSVHQLGITKVYLQSDMDPTLIKFFESICVIYQRRIEVVDAELIALAKDEGVEK